ncbi:HoxN/HupN/NixA family nickel/cobalt transporter [Methylobacterium oryzihabitans]|uniref:Nickel/cobalt efflux system n=1 Tax=Methylobacterium oryzihabitans TaxID=2499852 RepID=A0A3S2V8R2_9HYPH|nr:HoxN/HupN/NixA family nickel/cobalt transporter [Methylobacterium oryzihabitans]RVU18449.1 HoxN/HupN/NixA family nickel/cobalt transporter [Methylobacterium oryzihabitans]
MLPNPFDDQPAHLRAKVGLAYAVLIAANIAAWIAAFVVFANQPILMSTALLAYSFGLRHAFDADHIAAIDNVVRKLMQEGKKPYSVGLFFSLGHSTIVILASGLIAVTAAAMKDSLEEFHGLGGLIGTAVSATFLIVIGIANLFILRGVWAAFSRVRRGGKVVDEDLDALLAGRGLLARAFRRVFGVVSRSWHMYPIGFLFGLGFDTATEVALLGISATQATQGLSFWAILIFPALFTAGMTLMDTTDSVLMTGAYGWALDNPIRKLWYNLTITAASATIALFIGGLEALGLIGDKLGLEGGLWRVVGTLNDNLGEAGFAVVGIFVLAWIASVIVYRAKGYDRLEPVR